MISPTHKFARHKLEALRPTHASYVARLEALGRWEGDWLCGVPTAAIHREAQKANRVAMSLAGRKPEPIIDHIRRGLQPWPFPVRFAVKFYARFRTPEDRGIGDTVARHLGQRGEDFKTWFQSMFGHKCGCTDRQTWLNRNFPYDADGVVLV